MRSYHALLPDQIGILLNNDAIQALIEHSLQMISELSIRQAKAYMYVDEILVDYNDSHKMMRIKHSEGDISEQPSLVGLNQG
jgi:uncharacterized protein YqkB